MENLIALLVGLLVAVGVRLLLTRSLFAILIGLALLSQAANLLVFAAADLGDGTPPIIPADASGPSASMPDPLPQALVLTAIVISFGVLAFSLTLLRKTYGRRGEYRAAAMAKAERDWT